MTRDVVDAIERAASAAKTDTRRHRLWRSLERIHPFLGIHDTQADGEQLRANIHCVVTARCNYRCPFCQAFLSDAANDPPLAAVRDAIGRACRVVPGARWTFSGGEPTLRSDLSAIVQETLDSDAAATVVVQTNGALVERHPERWAVAPSPRLTFLVAVHALDDRTYDAVTATRGQLRHALAGLRALLAAGHAVELNCVISSLNVDHIVPYVEALPALVAPHAAPIVHLSVLGFTDVRDVSPWVVPYDRVVAVATAALAAGRRAGVDVQVSLTAHHSSVPVCLLDSAALDTAEYPHAYSHDVEHAADADWWTKPAACADCRMDRHCRGLPKPYVAALGGGGEGAALGVRPIPPVPVPVTPAGGATHR